MLPSYQPEDDKFFAFSSPQSYTTYPPSFSSVDTSMPLMDIDKRSSFSPSESLIPELLSAPSTAIASPVTPLTGGSFEMSASLENIRFDGPQTNLQAIFDLRTSEHHDQGQWCLDTSRENIKQNAYNPYPMKYQSTFGDGLPNQYYRTSSQPRSTHPFSPVLSRDIFNGAVSSSPIPQLYNDGIHWSPIVAPTTPRTINPASVVLLSSPPTMKDDLSTPSKHYPQSLLVLSSSPTTGYSSGILPSQHDIDDSSYFPDMAPELICETVERYTRGSRVESRLARRRYDRKGQSSSGKQRRPPPSKSGFDCEPVILQNSFACSYTDCRDKNTGKQKRFKRQEHKKRHEKTVHEKDCHGLHRCWVPLCTKSFTRTDNLKSHLTKTHGKRSPNARNRYVATLDPQNVEYYDPEWAGHLTEDGLPVGR